MALKPDLSADLAAQQVIRALLNGEAPPPGVTPERLGPWAETVQLLGEAQAEGGKEGVHRAFVVISRQIPALLGLMAGDANTDERTHWTVADLYDANLPPPRMVIENLLPVGTTNFASRPKKGKSWLAEQVADAVGTGGKVLGLQAVLGRVLYLALEDNPHRLRDRLLKQNVSRNANIDFYTAWEPLGQGGLPRLMCELTKGYALVIIDTLSRAIGHADQMDAADMTVLFSNLQHLAVRHNIALLMIDHHRKPSLASGSDPIDDIYGSTAKAGVIDAAWGLYRERNGDSAVLKITGRDLCEHELALQWDAEHFRWECQGEAQAVACSVRQQEVLDALRTLGRAQLRDLADATGQSRSNLFVRLQKLLKHKAIVRTEELGQVFYSVA